MLVPHCIENIFWSGLILVNSNDITTIKIDRKKKFVKRPKKLNKQKVYLKKIWAVKWIRETNSDYEMEKR